MRSLYIYVLRFFGALFRWTGLLNLLERHLDNKLCLFIRSLFSIYDVEDMLVLDKPWWTFPSIRVVEDFLLDLDGKANVFEYGSGASTAWLLKRAGRVASVEHDSEFAGIMENHVSDSANLDRLVVEPKQSGSSVKVCPSGRMGYESVDFADYVKSIEIAKGPFDLIVIDGRARSYCLREAEKHLKPGGIIVFDNSARPRYQEALLGTVLTLKRYKGFAPSLPYLEETSILRESK